MENIQVHLCKNCSTSLHGNFCAECGQKARTSKIDLQYLQDEAKYTLLHINNGFFYTIKQLLTRPGHAIREYIEGRRVKHYKPLLFLFVLAGVYGFLLHYIDIPAMVKLSMPEDNAKIDMMPVFIWMTSNYSLTEIILLPIVSFTSWFAFRKWGYNYIEHIILNAYSAGLRLTVSILFFPFLLIPDNIMLYSMIGGILSVTTYLLTGWTYMQFFSNKPAGATILRVIGMIALLFFIVIVIATIAIAITMTYFIKQG